MSLTKNQDLIHNDISDINPGNRFAFGRIVLIGDAAHATTPNMGQGACQAIEEAVVIGQYMADQPDFELAFKKFEEIRIKRTKWVTDTSRKIGQIAQLENRFLIHCDCGFDQQQFDPLLRIAVILQPQPLLPSAFLSSSNLQQASSLLAGTPPQQEIVEVFFGASFMICVFSKPLIVSVSIVCFLLLFIVMTLNGIKKTQKKSEPEVLIMTILPGRISSTIKQLQFTSSTAIAVIIFVADYIAINIALVRATSYEQFPELFLSALYS